MLNISVAEHRERSLSTSEIAQGAPRGGGTGMALLQETRRVDILTSVFTTPRSAGGSPETHLL